VALVVALLAASPAGSVSQDVTPIAPSTEQQVVPITPGATQRVEAVSADAAQQVQEGLTPDTAGTRAASTAGKIALAVFGAAMSIGLTVVSILFI
jgi:hypothetical protein